MKTQNATTDFSLNDFYLKFKNEIYNLLGRNFTSFNNFINASSDLYIISDEQDEIISKMIKDIDDYVKSESIPVRNTILFIPSYYLIKFTRIIDIFMMLSLKLRGCRIVPVITNQFHNEECIFWGGYYKKNRTENQKKYDILERKLWIDTLKAEPLFLTDYRSDADIIEGSDAASKINLNNYNNFVYKGFHAGKQAAIVTCNLNNMPILKIDDDLEKQLKIHTSNIVELVNAYEKIYNKLRPDFVVSNCAFYYKWGVPLHIALGLKIPFYSVSMAERKNCFFFSYNSYQMNDSSSAWKTFKVSELEQKEIDFIEHAVSTRMKKGVSYYSTYISYAKDENAEKIEKMLKSKPTAFFPANILFDSIVYQNSPAFENIIEMIRKTILFFNNNPQYQIIIKAHPCERIHYNDGPTFSENCLKSVIDRLDAKLNDNIIFIDFDSDLSSYDIYPYIKFGITWASSTAMEMCWLGKPVINVADAHYQNKGFTYEPQNENNYYELIHHFFKVTENPEEIEERIRLSKKYYYLYLYHSNVDFKLFQGCDYLIVQEKMLFNSFRELLPGKNKALDYICDSMTNKLPVFGENRWPPLTI